MSESPESPDISLLSRREREKRGGALPWSARLLPGGGPGSSILGGLLATKMGVAVGTGFLVASAAGGAALYQRLSVPSAEARRPVLGAVSGAGPSVKKPKDRSIDFVARANEGEIVFDRTNPQAGEQPAGFNAERRNPSKQAATPQAPDVNGLLAQAGKGGMKNDSFGRKLTKDTKELHGGRFTGIDKGYGDFQAMNLKRVGNGAPQFQPKGNLTAMSRNKNTITAGSKNISKVKTSSSRGQLALAGKLSGAGSSAAQTGGLTTGAEYASDAFDQQTRQGAPGASGVGEGTDATAPPMGGSAPDVTSPGGRPQTQDYSDQRPLMDQASALNQQASDTKQTAVMFMILGVALVVLGGTVAWMGGWGSILIIMGLALMAMAAMQMIDAGKKSDEADKIGQTVQDQYKQQDQGQAVRDCTAAARDGGDYDSCMANQELPEAATQDLAPPNP